jgi:hypothetical protein
LIGDFHINFLMRITVADRDLIGDFQIDFLI